MAGLVALLAPWADAETLERTLLDIEARNLKTFAMRSDILPVLDLDGHAVHIPYRITWALEAVSRPEVAPPGFHTLDSIREVPALVSRLLG